MKHSTKSRVVNCDPIRIHKRFFSKKKKKQERPK